MSAIELRSGWACPGCGTNVAHLSDVYDCMFGDGAVCIGCYTKHNEQKHPALYSGYPPHKTCQHGFPSAGKCGSCKRRC